MNNSKQQAFRIDRLKALALEFGGNTELGKKLGYTNGSHIGNLLSGYRPITEKFITKVETQLRCKGWFSFGAQDEAIQPITNAKNGVVVPLLAAAASMGQGEHDILGDTIAGDMVLSSVWIKQNINPISNTRNLRFLHAYGDSMEPTFKSGDVLLIDSGIQSADIDGIYVLEAQQRLFVKRVTLDVFGKYTISSDNPNVKTVSILNGSNDVKILGRVLWAWTGKRL